MGTDSKTAIQQPSSKVTIVSSSSSTTKNIRKKKSKTSHHKSKHNKQQRSESSSSRSSNDNERHTTSTSSKKSNKTKNLKDKNKISSSNETRNNDKKSSNNKKKSHRSKHDSSESPPKRNNTTRSRSKSRSRSERSSDRSSSRESSSRYRHKNSLRRPGSNMQNIYSPMSHSNFPPNMPRHYAPPTLRGGRMPPYMPPGMMGGPPMRNNNGNRRSGGNSPPQSLLGGYRPPLPNFRGRGGPMNNPAYVNMASMLNLIQQQQQKQKPGAHKYANPNNPNNRFYQQFQDNYKKISSGQKVSNLYQASFPVQHIPREMRFNFRLLGRNIFTASDEEEEEQQKKAAAAAAATSSEKRSKQRRDSSSSSDSHSDDDRRKRREDDDDEDEEKPSNTKSKLSPTNKTSNEPKRSSTKNNRNRTSSSTTTQHSKPAPHSHELLTDSSNLSTFLAGIMQSENSEIIANTLAAAAVVNSKRERTKKQQEKKVQKFKNYARFQQIQAAAGGVVPATNPDEVEKKIHGLARRLQMKTIGLHDDYESQGIKRSDESSVDSEGNERRHRSSGSSTERSKDKDAGSDASTNSQRQRKLKKMNKRTNKKVNSAGQLVGSSDSDQHRSDGNDSDGSMLNLNEDLKSISYYMKDRERMLHEMFRCVRGHKLQAILPDALKTRSLDEIKAKCLDQLDILSKKRIRAILLAQPMTSSSGTEDSTDEDEQDFFTLYPHLKSSLDTPNNNNASNAAASNTSTTIPPTDSIKKSLPNSKFRPVPMQVVTENTPSTFQSTLSAPVVVGGDEDVNDYYEGFKKIKKLTNLRRNEQDDEFLPFPDQTGKLFQPIGSNLPKFEFKPITGLTHSQQAHLHARRAAYRQQQQQQQQQMDVRQEIEDLLNIEDFVLPDGERPLSSAELSTNEQRRYGLPPRLHHKIPAGPPKKGSLGDLLKQKNKQSGERSPSPMIDERNSKRQRRRRSRSLSSTGSGQWSRSSSLSNNEDRTSRHSSREITPTLENKNNGRIEGDITDMDDLSKLLDLNEEDELLLLQIEVEQEERNIRREEKRRRKEEKKTKKINKKPKLISNTDDQKIIQQFLNDLIENIIIQEENKTNSKRTFDDSDHELSKKVKLEEET